MTEQDRPTWLVGWLVGAAMLTTAAPLVGVVSSADGSSTEPLLGSAWLTLIPALAAALLLVLRPQWANAVAAGVGLVGASRLVGDFGLLIDPTNALRPDLFSTTSATAPPLSASTGVSMLIGADLICLVVMIMAAGELFAALPELADSGEGRQRLLRSTAVMTTGLVGVALSVGAMFSPLYTGINPPPGLVKNLDIGIAALGGGALLGLLAMLAVILAASLPRPESIGLLLGTGLAMAIPPLTAVTAPLFDDAAGPSFTGWLALIAAALIGAAGFLQRADLEVPVESEPQMPVAVVEERELRPLSAVWTYLPSVLALAAGVLAIIAARSQQATQLDIVLIRIAFPDPVARAAQESAISAPAGQGLTAAAVLLLVAAVLAIVPRGSTLGRYAVMAAAAASLAATAYGFDYLGSMNLSTFQQLGQGLWQSDTGLVLGAVAAGLSVLAVIAVLVRDSRQSELDENAVDGDEPWDDRAPWPLWVGSGLTVLVVLAYAGPVFRAAQHGDGPRLLGAIRLQDYGALLSLVAVLVLLWSAVRSIGSARPTRRVELVGTLLLAAALVTSRIVLPSSVRELTDFSLRWGYPMSVVLVAGLVLAVPAGWWWLSAGPEQAPVRDRVGNLTTGRDAEDRLT